MNIIKFIRRKGLVYKEFILRINIYVRVIFKEGRIPVEFKFLGAEEYGLSSPVLSGEKLYVAGIVDKVPYSDVAFGYSMEQLVLYAWSLGIGTVWIGGTVKYPYLG